jgi:hypothetical protein
MNQFDGELAALRHQRAMDEATSSPLVDNLVEATITIAENVGLPLTGLIRRALASGKIPVEKMIDNLESAVDEQIKRIWEYLRGKEKQQEEFAARLRSQEAQSAYLSAFFHGLRTSDPEKHRRLGRLTVNCIFADDLKPESLDDTMRAAVELKDSDIILLGHLYKYQNHILTEKGMSPTKWYSDIQSAKKRLVESGTLDAQKHLSYRSSYLRLEALGLAQEITSMNNFDGVGLELYALLMEGKKFYERLQEIEATR